MLDVLCVATPSPQRFCCPLVRRSVREKHLTRQQKDFAEPSEAGDASPSAHGEQRGRERRKT